MNMNAEELLVQKEGAGDLRVRETLAKGSPKFNCLRSASSLLQLTDIHTDPELSLAKWLAAQLARLAELS
ncbi:hypothetical protein Q3G72_016474 [Acer saccharum]|nr:hypothetical protein Q3G72_016474 [Acer saccharum]